MTNTTPSSSGDAAPKLIIDSDWKSQAQAEKERLAASARPAAKPASKPASMAPGATAADPLGVNQPGVSQPGAEPADPEQTEEIGFQDLLSLLVTNALTYMGAFADPKTGRAVVAPDMARVYIDMLGVLESKTKGNLSDEESTLLTRSLSELRLEYVELSKMVQKAVAEGKIKPQSLGGPMGGPMAGPMGGTPRGPVGTPGFGIQGPSGMM
jgi:hypothetical protein